jgi:hypothetical protein
MKIPPKDGTRQRKLRQEETEVSGERRIKKMSEMKIRVRRKGRKNINMNMKGKKI